MTRPLTPPCPIPADPEETLLLHAGLDLTNPIHAAIYQAMKNAAATSASRLYTSIGSSLNETQLALETRNTYLTASAAERAVYDRFWVVSSPSSGEEHQVIDGRVSQPNWAIRVLLFIALGEVGVRS